MSAAATEPPSGDQRADRPFSTERRRALRRLEVAVQLAWVLPLAAFAVVAALLYRQYFAEAEQDVDRASRIAQEQALKLFETNAMLLQRMLDLLGDATDGEALARGAELHARLKAMAQGLPQVQGLFALGADARMLANSLVFPPPRQIDFGDREGVIVHRRPNSGVFITEQLRSRISGEPFFDMSVRRVRSDGSFAGSVSVSLRPSYLTEFYAELAQSEPGLRFSVFKADGRLVARWPSAFEPGARIGNEHPTLRAIAAGASAGFGRGTLQADGAERLFAFRQLSPYPVYVAAAVDASHVRGAWLKTLGALALFVVPATLVLTWMARTALTRTRRELTAAQRLDDETLLRQRMEVALLQSQKLEALGRLTSGVAHDFNNLLAVVTNSLYVHRAKQPEAQGSAQLAAIERAVKAGTKLTRQLLAFTRRQTLVPQRVQLQERLPELIDLITPLLGKDVELRAEADPDTPAIQVDAAELELALINLAVNARDAMPHGGRLEIRARPADRVDTGAVPTSGDAPAGVMIEVADTGTGIAPEIIDRVFEPFFTTKPVGEGTGLGLSQVQALCQSAGGHALVEPRPGGGTRVRLYLPALAQARAPSEPEIVPEAPPTLRGSVLLVEDNPAVAQSTHELLIAMGLDVQRAASGDDALGRVEREPTAFHLVLSDVEMPGELDGIALAERLRERYPALPVVLVTGYAERLRPGVQKHFDVLPKPVAPQTLAEVIAKALARRPVSTRA